MSDEIRLAAARVSDLAAVMRVMDAAFDPAYGEAWSGAQLFTLFALPSARVALAWDGERPCGFYAARIAGPESELLLLAVDPSDRGRGIGARLIEQAGPGYFRDSYIKPTGRNLTASQIEWTAHAEKR